MKSKIKYNINENFSEEEKERILRDYPDFEIVTNEKGEFIRKKDESNTVDENNIESDYSDFRDDTYIKSLANIIKITGWSPETEKIFKKVFDYVCKNKKTPTVKIEKFQDYFLNDLNYKKQPKKNLNSFLLKLGR